MPRKKSSFVEEESNEEKYEEVWDYRKIAAGVIILILLLFGGLIVKRLILHQSIAPASFLPKLPSVKGVATGPADQTKVSHVTIKLPSPQDVQNQIQTIQNQVTHLNVAEIASSSPQVQQILQQIENIPSGSTNQVKDACVRLCNNL